jgi:short-subunit dehydrogenase
MPEAARVVVADLATDTGIDQVAQVCADQPITMLVNNADQPITMLVNNAGLATLTPQGSQAHEDRDLHPTAASRTSPPGTLTGSSR